MVLLSQLEKLYKCDKCGHKFKGKDALLKRVTGGFEGVALFASFVYVDKNGKIIGGSKSPGTTDKTLHCPKCKALHLFGFDPV
jgi:hypothetical protein